MSKSNATEADVISFIFNSVAFPVAYGTTLYISLHTADPGEGGTQTTNETAYTNYARQAVTRNGTAGWDCTTLPDRASNKALIQFPQCGATPGPAITHVAIGLGSGTTAGQILYSGALNSPLAIATLIQPQFGIGALVITED